MIHPSTFLSRALLADAIFSGVAAVALTLGAGVLAPFLNLPEALLRETGLFLIAYTALVGWLATRSSGGEGAGVARHRGQCRVDARQHRAAVLGRGVAEPARSGLYRGPGDCDRRVCGAAIYRPAQERRAVAACVIASKRRIIAKREWIASAHLLSFATGRREHVIAAPDDRWLHALQNRDQV